MRYRDGFALTATNRYSSRALIYATGRVALLVLLTPISATTETIQGVARHQILSLCYSLPSQEEASSWHNDLIREEALSLAWLLDSL